MYWRDVTSSQEVKEIRHGVFTANGRPVFYQNYEVRDARKRLRLFIRIEELRKHAEEYSKEPVRCSTCLRELPRKEMTHSFGWRLFCSQECYDKAFAPCEDCGVLTVHCETGTVCYLCGKHKQVYDLRLHGMARQINKSWLSADIANPNGDVWFIFGWPDQRPKWRLEEPTQSQYFAIRPRKPGEVVQNLSIQKSLLYLVDWVWIVVQKSGSLWHKTKAQWLRPPHDKSIRKALTKVPEVMGVE